MVDNKIDKLANQFAALVVVDPHMCLQRMSLPDAEWILECKGLAVTVNIKQIYYDLKS
jgi:hypothetical protein